MHGDFIVLFSQVVQGLLSHMKELILIKVCFLAMLLYIGFKHLISPIRNTIAHIPASV